MTEYKIMTYDPEAKRTPVYLLFGEGIFAGEKILIVKHRAMMYRFIIYALSEIYDENPRAKPTRDYIIKKLMEQKEEYAKRIVYRVEQLKHWDESLIEKQKVKLKHLLSKWDNEQTMKFRYTEAMSYLRGTLLVSNFKTIILAESKDVSRKEVITFTDFGEQVRHLVSKGFVF